MKHFRSIYLETGLGNFAAIFKEAKELSVMADIKVSFKFNGTLFNITKHSTLDKCWQDYKPAGNAVFGEGW